MSGIISFDEQAFMNPKNEYRVQPFWFWNGEMDNNEIYRQIKEMSEKGVGGFFICPRQGLKIPYLSEKWFEKVKYAVDIAKEFGLEVWLYDEYPYPSGIAGGEVTLIHPEAKHFELIHKCIEIQDEELCELELPWGRLLSAQAVPIDSETGKKMWDQSIEVSEFVGNYQADEVFQQTGLTAYNQKRYFTYTTKKKLNWTTPAGKWEVHCFLEVEVNDFKYYGEYIDPCHVEAVDTFIEITHNRYADKLGSDFGTTVKGMFTDETGLLGDIPWSTSLLTFFENENGYDLRKYLHALIDRETEYSAKVRYDYFQAIHNLLTNNYHKKMHDWCEKHGLSYIAEVPSVRMTTQKYSHIPGGDSAHEKVGKSLQWIMDRYGSNLRENPKLLSSLGNQLKRQRILIECFHSVGWSMTLQDAKWMLDRLGAMGVNYYNFHAFFYTVDGLKKHDAPPSQFLQNPYWEHFRLLGDYAGRLSYIMSCGIPLRSIAVLDPTTSLWTHMGNPFSQFVYFGEDEIEKQKLEKLITGWTNICQELSYNYKDYDHLDPEILSNSVIDKGCIKIGNASYSTLILPPITNIEISAWNKIKEFLNQGGTVIANVSLPYEKINKESLQAEIYETFGLNNQNDFDEVSHKLNKKRWIKGNKNAYFIPEQSNSGKLLLSLLKETCQEKVTFQTKKQSKSFLAEKRLLPDESMFVFISNQEDGNHTGIVSVEKKALIQRLDLDTGKIEDLLINKTGEIELQFKPYQSHLIRVIPNQTNSDKQECVRKELPYQLNIKTNDSWELTPVKNNILRFDRFNMWLNNQEGQSVSVSVKTFIDQCKELTEKQKLPLAFQQIFGTPIHTSIKYPISCVYETSFNIEKLPRYCDLLKGKESLIGNFKILLNNHEINKFKDCFVYDYRNQSSNVLPYLKEGKNILRIEMLIENDHDGLIDALYLKGDFGVKLQKENEPILVENKTKESSISSKPYPNYPYYAGNLSLKRKFMIEKLPYNRKIVVNLQDVNQEFHDCLEVKINGVSLGVKAWSPYEWIGRTSILKEGSNELELIVTNTLMGLLEGKTFDYSTHRVIDLDNE